MDKYQGYTNNLPHDLIIFISVRQKYCIWNAPKLLKKWRLVGRVWGPPRWKVHKTPFLVFFFSYSFFFSREGFEFRALHLQSKCSTAWATPPVHFAMVILEMGSHKVFTKLAVNSYPLDLSLPSSRIIGLSHWHLDFILINKKTEHGGAYLLCQLTGKYK
jgi:hypothetical protein